MSPIGTTDTSASFSWTPGADTLFNIEYGGTGFQQGTGTFINGVTTLSTTVNGLMANTCYDFYVQTDCGGGSTSPWFGPLTMCTNCSAFTAPWTDDLEGGTWTADDINFSAANSIIDACLTVSEFLTTTLRQDAPATSQPTRRARAIFAADIPHRKSPRRSKR